MNRSYTFYDVPNCLLGRSYLQTCITPDVFVTIKSDGVVNVADVLTVLKAVIAGDESEADMNGDDSLNLLDVIHFLKRIV